MIADLNIITGASTIKTIHYIVSVTFLIFAVWLVFRSVRGITLSKHYARLDKFLSYAFIINLYVQLVFGLILFSNLGSPEGYEYLGAGGELKGVSKRLWPIEHIILMLFALFIANLGLISTSKSQKSKVKHRKILIYYLVSVAIIAYSLLSIYLL